MAQASVNNFVRSGISGALAIGVDLTVNAGAIAAGDMIYLTGNKTAASLNTAGGSNANAANFLGVSIDQYPLPITQGVTAPYAGGVNRVQYRREGEFKFYTTNADTYAAGDAVYLGADGQTVQKTALGTSIGKVSTDQRAVGVQLGSSITGATGVQVVIRINPAI